MPHDHLTRASLATLRRVFSTLPPAPPSARSGFYQASFIGPAWLRVSARPGIVLGGLPGWLGKRFIDTERATNVLQRRHGCVEKLEMHCTTRTSLVDGAPGVDLSYGDKGPIPWRWVRDELRQLDEHRLLAMTVIDLPGLRRLALPFLLSRANDPGA